jgi:VWFA-related protein
MVIDDLHTYFGRTTRVRAAARQFIEQHLGANDLMAVVHTAGPTDANQEFTADKRLLMAAVDRTSGRKLESASMTRNGEALRGVASAGRETGPITDSADAERQANARRTLDALKNVADWFSTVRGRRKAILFFSEGIDYDITDLESSGAPLVISSTRDALAAAARGNVSIYAVDPRGLTSGGDQTIEVQTFAAEANQAVGEQAVRNELFLSQGSLRQLADESGGFAVLNTNSFANAFDRIVRDNSSYYAMAYYPPMAKAGKLHRIEVRVRRPGLVVRARQGYVTPQPSRSGGDLAGASEARPGPALPDVGAALNSPLPVSGLGMRVFAVPYKGSGSNASVLIGVELRGRDLGLAADDKIQLAYVAVDANGKDRGGDGESLAMKLHPDVKDRIGASGLRLLKRIDLGVGRYQLRVAAHDQGSGKAGSVVYDLTVPDFVRPPLAMSGIALTSASALAAPTLWPDEPLKQVLPGPPVAVRTFPQNDQIALFVEVYDNRPSPPHKVDIRTTVATEEGRVMITAEETRDSSELKGRSGAYGYRGAMALKDLDPGDYVLTVAAKSRLVETPAVERQLRFTVTAPIAPASR